MADLPIVAVIRIAKANGAERVGSDLAALLVKKAEEYIEKLTKKADKLATYTGKKYSRLKISRWQPRTKLLLI